MKEYSILLLPIAAMLAIIGLYQQIKHDESSAYSYVVIEGIVLWSYLLINRL